MTGEKSQQKRPSSDGNLPAKPRDTKEKPFSPENAFTQEEEILYSDVRDLITKAKKRAAVAVNWEAVMANWQVGSRIRTDVLKNQRAEYGKQIVAKLAGRLTMEFGHGWETKQLLHCLRAAETFSQEQIVYALRRQLNWTHLRTLMYEKSELKRTFYWEMAWIERWSTRPDVELLKMKLQRAIKVAQDVLDERKELEK